MCVSNLKAKRKKWKSDRWNPRFWFIQSQLCSPRIDLTHHAQSQSMGGDMSGGVGINSGMVGMQELGERGFFLEVHTQSVLQAFSTVFHKLQFTEIGHSISYRPPLEYKLYENLTRVSSWAAKWTHDSSPAKMENTNLRVWSLLDCILGNLQPSKLGTHCALNLTILIDWNRKWKSLLTDLWKPYSLNPPIFIKTNPYLFKLIPFSPHLESSCILWPPRIHVIWQCST